MYLCFLHYLTVYMHLSTFKNNAIWLAWLISLVHVWYMLFVWSSRFLTTVPDSLDCSEVQRGASESSSWVEGPPCASCCTFSFRWLMNTELSWGGCQRGFLMVKCIRDNSVLPFSACWYMEASVWPSDSHCKNIYRYTSIQAATSQH